MTFYKCSKNTNKFLLGQIIYLIPNSAKTGGLLSEDNMTLRTLKKAAMLACFNNIAINILRKNGYRPTKAVFAKIANKVNELYKLFLYD